MRPAARECWEEPRVPGDMRWERDKCACGCASRDSGGRGGGPGTQSEWVCVGRGADPRRCRRRRRFRGVCVWGGPRPGPGTLGAAFVCPGPPSGVARPGRVSVRGGRRAAGPGEPLSPGPGRKRAGLQRGLPAWAPARPPARSPPASRLGRLPGRRARGGPARCLGPGQVRVGGGTRRSPWPRPPPRLLRRGEGVFWRWSCQPRPSPAVGPEGK